jgi:hypothetical protein
MTFELSAYQTLRQYARDARDNLRREIQNNRQRYAENLQKPEKNRHQLAYDIDQLKDLRAGKAIDKAALS